MQRKEPLVAKVPISLGWFAWRQGDVVAGGEVADVVLGRVGLHDKCQAAAWLPRQDDVLRREFAHGKELTGGGGQRTLSVRRERARVEGRGGPLGRREEEDLWLTCGGSSGGLCRDEVVRGECCP